MVLLTIKNLLIHPLQIAKNLWNMSKKHDAISMISIVFYNFINFNENGRKTIRNKVLSWSQ